MQRIPTHGNMLRGQSELPKNWQSLQNSMFLFTGLLQIQSTAILNLE